MLYWLTEDKNIQAKYYFIKRNKLILKKQNLKFEPFLKLLLWTLINSVDSFDSKLLDFFNFYLCICIYVSLCMPHQCMFPQRPKEAIKSSRTEGKGYYELGTHLSYLSLWIKSKLFQIKIQ